MSRKIAFVLGIIIIVALLNSCKKTTETQLVNGLWKLNSVNIDTSSANFLSSLPGFGNGHTAYKLSFQESDVVFAYYVSNDSIIRYSVGTWTVPAYSQVYIKVDSFIDGTFNIDRSSLYHWQLTSNYNHIASFDNGVNPQFDTTYTKLDITRY
jgi:hypothetical protein